MIRTDATPRAPVGRIVLTLAVGYAVLAGLVALTLGTSPTAVQVLRGPEPGTTRVVMTDARTEPRRLTVRAGETVTWLNRSTAAQTIMLGAGGWESAVLEPGDSYRHTFTTPGTYRYTCGRDAAAWTSTITVTSNRGPAMQSAGSA